MQQQTSQDILNSTVVATINVGVNPTGMAITPDSAKLYVGNGNNYGIAGSDSVTVIDLKTLMPVKTIHSDSFSEPYTVTLSKDGTKLYVTNSDQATISIVDTTTDEVVGTIDGSGGTYGLNGPSGMAISPDGTKAYVNNYGASNAVPSGSGNTVSVIDLTNNTITGEIHLSPSGGTAAAPATLAITPDGQFVYTANYVNGEPWEGTVSKISTATNTVVETIGGYRYFSGSFAMSIDANGKFAYLTNFGSNNFAPYGTTVSILDLETKQAKLVEVGIQPAGFAITTDGRYGLVTNYNTLYKSGAPNFTGLTAGQGTVNIIDLATHTLVPITINVGQSPRAVVMSPDGKYAVISCYTSNTVSVIRLYGE